MCRQLPQMSIKAGSDEDKQCRLRSCSSKVSISHPRALYDHCLPPLCKKNESIVLLTFLHSRLKSLFYTPTRDSENWKLHKDRWTFQNYLQAQVCHLCKFFTKSTMIVLLWQKVFMQNFTETNIFKSNKLINIWTVF